MVPLNLVRHLTRLKVRHSFLLLLVTSALLVVTMFAIRITFKNPSKPSLPVSGPSPSSLAQTARLAAELVAALAVAPVAPVVAPVALVAS